MQSPIMRWQEVARALEVSRNQAYIIIRQFIDELKSKGFYVQAGRVSRKYFYERTGLQESREEVQENATITYQIIPNNEDDETQETA